MVLSLEEGEGAKVVMVGFIWAGILSCGRRMDGGRLICWRSRAGGVKVERRGLVGMKVMEDEEGREVEKWMEEEEQMGSKRMERGFLCCPECGLMYAVRPWEVEMVGGE